MDPWAGPYVSSLRSGMLATCRFFFVHSDTVVSKKVETKKTKQEVWMSVRDFQATKPEHKKDFGLLAFIVRCSLTRFAVH